MANTRLFDSWQIGMDLPAPFDRAIDGGVRYARELITMDVYGDNGNIIAEEIPPELLSYIEEVLAEKKKDNIENVLDTLINVEKIIELMFALRIQFHISMI